jgi:dethiobiotin synthetase
VSLDTGEIGKTWGDDGDRSATGPVAGRISVGGRGGVTMRPERLVLVCGSGTDVGKTWVSCRLLSVLSARGVSVAARKPVQSFDNPVSDIPAESTTDADLLGAASGEPADVVCRPSRNYSRAMAPPMAADALGLPPFTIADLVEEMEWPDRPVAVGVVETAGGVRSPQAIDGDATDLMKILGPDLVVLVADAGLGTINVVRMSMDALASVTAGTPTLPVVVVLDRYDDHHEIHRRNRHWLVDRLGYPVLVVPGEEEVLADAAAGVEEIGPAGVRSGARPIPPPPG